MNILLVGSGGREHALAWKMAQSDLCTKLYCAPGNAGIAAVAENVPDVGAEDIDGIVNFARGHAIDFVVVGPEAPLVDGLADRLKDAGIDVFGPSAAAAQLEGSKGFMKDMCAEFDIPTARYQRFTDLDAAKAFIRELDGKLVIKTDGLAAGKGVIIPTSIEEADEAVAEMLSGEAFGAAGTSVVIEEFLEGEELSFFALSDGKSVVALPTAQDHKRVGDGDTGPNTGGMGAYSPAHLSTPALEQKIMDRIVKPTIDGMASRGTPYTGVLFAGIMIVNGEPYLIEHNVRFGDPECQTLMMRMESDLVELLQACAQGRLAEVAEQVRFSDDVALVVVLAAKGYPGTYEKGSIIGGLEAADAVEGVKVFHAGTAAKDGDVISIGGRVLGVTARGASVAEAQGRAYAAVDKLDWPEGFCRRDIAWRALKAEEEAA